MDAELEILRLKAHGFDLQCQIQTMQERLAKVMTKIVELSQRPNAPENEQQPEQKQ